MGIGGNASAIDARIRVKGNDGHREKGWRVSSTGAVTRQATLSDTILKEINCISHCTDNLCKSAV